MRCPCRRILVARRSSSMSGRLGSRICAGLRRYVSSLRRLESEQASPRVDLRCSRQRMSHNMTHIGTALLIRNSIPTSLPLSAASRSGLQETLTVVTSLISLDGNHFTAVRSVPTRKCHSWTVDLQSDCTCREDGRPLGNELLSGAGVDVTALVILQTNVVDRDGGVT